MRHTCLLGQTRRVAQCLCARQTAYQCQWGFRWIDALPYHIPKCPLKQMGTNPLWAIVFCGIPRKFWHFNHLCKIVYNINIQKMFHNIYYAIRICTRKVKMSPICKVEMSHSLFLTMATECADGIGTDERAGAEPA